MKNIKNLKIIKQKEDQNLYSPPSSPPPPHLIYFPETYAGTKSWQQIPQEEHITEEKKGYLIRRKIYTIAKTLIKTLFKNNNLLLIINIINKLWKARASFIHPTLLVINNLIFIIRYDGYKNIFKFILNHHHHSSKSQEIISNPINSIHSLILLLTTLTHLLVQFQKITYKWASHTIRNMGGLDSVILALSAIIFAKSIQRTTLII